MPADHLGEDPLAALLGSAEVVDLLDRLGLDPSAVELDLGAADQLLTGLGIVAAAVTRLSAGTGVGDRLGAQVDAPESPADARRRRAGVRIDVQDDDAASEDVTGT